MNSLNIVHFNPDGIRGCQTNILNYIDQENTHVIAVSETHLKPSQHFSLGNFIPTRAVLVFATKRKNNVDPLPRIGTKCNINNFAAK